MAVPTYEELMNPALEALRKLGGSASISELAETVAMIMKLPEQDFNALHKGKQTKFKYNLAWTKYYLKGYGLIEKSSRGVWALTPQGLRTQSVDPRDVKKVVGDPRHKRKRVAQTTPADDDSVEDMAWKEELLNTILELSPEAFERLCQRVLRESGFIHVEVTGHGKDNGIDGKGVVRVGGLLSFHVIFQAKRYKGSVSAPVVRDFRGAMVGRADKGLIITTGSFTRDARIEAQRDGASPIDLVDGEDLAEKLKALSLGVRTQIKTTEVIEINKDWFVNL